MGFSRSELEAFRNATVPDLIGPNCRLLFVGINPGLWTAGTQTHFAHPSNRFYPALHRAGLIETEVDPAAGMDGAERAHVTSRGIGITNLVARATARASELTAQELREGGARLRRTVAGHMPDVVAVLGITAYRQAFGQRQAALGPQPEPFERAELWVVPNPSGLNAHETTASLAEWFQRLGVASGVLSA